MVAINNQTTLEALNEDRIRRATRRRIKNKYDLGPKENMRAFYLFPGESAFLGWIPTRPKFDVTTGTSFPTTGAVDNNLEIAEKESTSSDEF